MSRRSSTTIFALDRSPDVEPDRPDMDPCAESEMELEAGHAVALKVYGHRPLEHIDRNDETPISLLLDQNAFEVFEGTASNANALAFA